MISYLVGDAAERARQASRASRSRWRRNPLPAEVVVHFPPWINAVEPHDECVYEVLAEFFQLRALTIARGAAASPRARKALAQADRHLVDAGLPSTAYPDVPAFWSRAREAVVKGMRWLARAEVYAEQGK